MYSEKDFKQNMKISETNVKIKTLNFFLKQIIFKTFEKTPDL